MKIALLNDTHFGVRNDSEAFRKYQLRFYNEIFFPYLKENNINTLVHLGDVVDRRKFINFQTASIFREQFWDRLYKEKIDTHIIIGNHDTYFKNTNEVNAIENLYTSFDRKHEPFIYTKSTVVDFDGTPIDDVSTFDFNIGKYVQPRFRVGFQISDILDREFEILPNYGAGGRTFSFIWHLSY